MEEVANGEKVLVPKVYLSKNALKSIVEEQGNIIKADGNNYTSRSKSSFKWKH